MAKLLGFYLNIKGRLLWLLAVILSQNILETPSWWRVTHSTNSLPLPISEAMNLPGPRLGSEKSHNSSEMQLAPRSWFFFGFHFKNKNNVKMQAEVCTRKLREVSKLHSQPIWRKRKLAKSWLKFLVLTVLHMSKDCNISSPDQWHYWKKANTTTTCKNMWYRNSNGQDDHENNIRPQGNDKFRPNLYPICTYVQPRCVCETAPSRPRDHQSQDLLRPAE